MPRSTTQLAIGAVIALGMAIVGLSATGTPLNMAQTLDIRDKPLLSQTGAARGVVGIRCAISSNLKLPDQAARSIG